LRVSSLNTEDYEFLSNLEDTMVDRLDISLMAMAGGQFLDFDDKFLYLSTTVPGTAINVIFTSEYSFTL